MSFSIYPIIVSQNGQYSLALKNNVLGVYNKDNALVSGSEKRINVPLFYSGLPANGGIATTGSVDSGTLAASNGNSGGYWGKAYTWVNTNMSDTSFVNKIGWIWSYANATNANGGKTEPTFIAVYNNPSTSSISATLYVSVIEHSLVYHNDVLILDWNWKTSWGNVFGLLITLKPGANTFKFMCYNSGGRCGLSFWCMPTTITSCDCQLNNSGGQLMLKNIAVAALDSNSNIATSITGLITDYAIYTSTTVAGPYTMTLNDNGSLTFVNSQGTSYYITPAHTTSPW
jgi:hypothetical protein